MKEQVIHSTNNYGLFRISKDNRDIDLNNPYSRSLRKSLQKYGWLSSFPMMVKSTDEGFVIIDGQHRFSIARELNNQVKFVIDNTDIDVSEINSAQKIWSNEDFLNRWVKHGLKDYFEIKEFSEKHKISVSISASLLAGTYSFSNVRDKFRNGKYKVKTRQHAEKIISQYNSLLAIRPDIKNVNLIKAIYACNYVSGFDPDRLIDTALKYPKLLDAYSRIDDYLDMIEEIYNYGKKTKRVPISFFAKEAMKDRNPTK